MLEDGTLDVVRIGDAAEGFNARTRVRSDEVLGVGRVTQPPGLDNVVARRVRDGLELGCFGRVSSENWVETTEVGR